MAKREKNYYNNFHFIFPGYVSRERLLKSSDAEKTWKEIYEMEGAVEDWFFPFHTEKFWVTTAIQFYKDVDDACERANVDETKIPKLPFLCDEVVELMEPVFDLLILAGYNQYDLIV